MAEKHSTNANGSQAPLSTCTVADCHIHLEGTTTSDKIAYPFRVHFKNEKEVLAHALESMQRVVAYKARTGKPIQKREDNAPVDIYHTGESAESFEDRVEALSQMTPEDLERERKKYEAFFAAARAKQAVKAK